MARDISNLGLKFQEIARATPQATAIVLEEQSYDFEALNALANQMARWLLARGIGRGDIACLQLPKSLEAYALVIACLKIGAPYAFLDPDAPPKRVRLTLERCAPAIVVGVHDGAGRRRSRECGAAG